MPRVVERKATNRPGYTTTSMGGGGREPAMGSVPRTTQGPRGGPRRRGGALVGPTRKTTAPAAPASAAAKRPATAAAAREGPSSAYREPS